MESKVLDMAIPPERARWKIQTWNRDTQKPQALYVPYFDARDVADRLDFLFGWDGWSDELVFQEIKGTAFAISRITTHPRRPDSATGTAGWDGTTKTDAAPLSDIEAIKGGASDAFKRAAAKLGVGRNAYSLPTFWASCEIRGEGDKAKPAIPRGHQQRLTRRMLEMLAAAEPNSEEAAGI